jgi:hypothetical protein
MMVHSFCLENKFIMHKSMGEESKKKEKCMHFRLEQTCLAFFEHGEDLLFH